MNEIQNDGLFEALFRQAVIDNFERELKALPSEIELAKSTVFSKRHIDNMKKMFARDSRRTLFKTISKWTQRVAVAILLTISLLFCALMTVQEIRAAVVRTVIQWFEQFALFSSYEAMSSMIHLEPSYLSEGYIESERVETDEMISIIYINTNNDILHFLAIPLDSHFLVDSEEITYELIIAEGMEYHVFYADMDNKNNMIVWEYRGIRLSISAPLPIETLIVVAQSVQ